VIQGIHREIFFINIRIDNGIAYKDTNNTVEGFIAVPCNVVLFEYLPCKYQNELYVAKLIFTMRTEELQINNILQQAIPIAFIKLLVIGKCYKLLFINNLY